MRDNLVEQIISEVMKKPTDAPNRTPALAAVAGCGLTEFVGTALGHTIGLVIANVDHQLHELMNIDKKFRSIGILGARTGAGPHIFAADEAVKATNSEILIIELARDTEGGGGHGCLIIFGAQDVSDVRRAVEVALSEIDRTMGDVYGSPAGHLEFQYTARASYALNKAFGAPVGKSFGMTCASPAAIGVVLADAASKAAVVEPIGYASPSKGTSFSNEVIFTFAGDSGAVRQAVIAARDVGLQLLATLDPAEIKSTTTPYI
ncbi:propanediol utilization microcompartment protein PduB [Brenneria tiliae]|uniref:propanediol utilization microcompartment protein PduB n=1 Tax=Brenneria tiliae TaxID=2914984 RepID=UPI002014BFBA|nr:propanediol utilization microcompartment protein PduB [Brenneria tiliae]MCL2899659.1 propanediol utilization microcompartment protein PduB [Brenneria tiliae]MCL2904037.1 propanediol utilization microcompartment protein PduB [Brenneria tiliae]